MKLENMTLKEFAIDIWKEFKNRPIRTSLKVIAVVGAAAGYCLATKRGYEEKDQKQDEGGIRMLAKSRLGSRYFLLISSPESDRMRLDMSLGYYSEMLAMKREGRDYPLGI